MAGREFNHSDSSNKDDGFLNVNVSLYNIY